MGYNNYRDQPFAKRFATMGDEAEGVYQDATPLGKTTRFGFRRPKGIKFGALPDPVKHMPDFITTTYLVEVCGLGRDGILKSIKVSKYEALKLWDKIAKQLGLLGVCVFVWNSSTRQFIVLNWKAIVDEVAYSKRKHGGPLAFENDGNEYYPLDWERLKDKAQLVGAWD